MNQRVNQKFGDNDNDYDNLSVRLRLCACSSVRPSVYVHVRLQVCFNLPVHDELVDSVEGGSLIWVTHDRHCNQGDVAVRGFDRIGGCRH